MTWPMWKKFGLWFLWIVALGVVPMYFSRDPGERALVTQPLLIVGGLGVLAAIVLISVLVLRGLDALRGPPPEQRGFEVLREVNGEHIEAKK
jgi:hypothetical protein